jgi:hypothetical protein
MEAAAEWSCMPGITGEQLKDLAAAAFEERDPQQITDLIEQLDRDLAETWKNAAKER